MARWAYRIVPIEAGLAALELVSRPAEVAEARHKAGDVAPMSDSSLSQSR